MSRKSNYLTVGSDDLLCFLVLTLIVVSSTADTCSRKFIILTIDHRDCRPRQIMTRACGGNCLSYTRPSVELHDTVEHFCQCCDADDVRLVETRVWCPNNEWQPGQRRFRRIRVVMNLPLSCRCRPCSLTPHEIIPAENDILSTMKRNDDGIQFLNRTKSNYVSHSTKAKKPFIYFDDKNITFSLKEIY